ncbi:MAG TPA: divergent polysaccharide deacetylase family protein [Candidatus Eremiobacteraceae bacterium]|nr:divergent polysaccharide deacetylase family protein [Candidatus Eremiobacteraceae bacterium]
MLPSSFANRSFTTRSPFLKIVALLCIFIAGATGCHRGRQKRLTEEDIHRITREFVFAANSAAPRGSEVHGEVGAFDKVANSFDLVEIHIFSKRKGKEYPPAVSRLLDELNGIATAHGLTPDPQTENGDAIFLSYRHAGVVTHTVHIHFAGSTDISRNSDSAPATSDNQAPRLAIILDDLGNDSAAAQAVFAMPYPLTISVLPNQTHSAEIAQQARRRGDEVMLHLPMQSLAKEHPEAQELHGGMSRADISRLVSQFLKEVPGVIGVNNHQGSASTADKKLMAKLMPVLKEHKLFYVDSRTSAATVAFDTAQRFGVRAAFRNVPFLDDVENVSAVRKQIEIAIADTARKKDAIAIGHAHPSTLEALKETLPLAKAHGVKLVFASELVR